MLSLVTISSQPAAHDTFPLAPSQSKRNIVEVYLRSQMRVGHYFTAAVRTSCLYLSGVAFQENGSFSIILVIDSP